MDGLREPGGGRHGRVRLRVAGGLATVLGGLGVLDVAVAGVGYAGSPLAASLTTGSGESGPPTRRTCPDYGTEVTTGSSACPGCGQDLLAAA